MQKVKISHNKPPHYLLIKIIFGFDWSRNVATLGDTIYFSIPELPSHLMEHEETHLKQQRFSKLYGIWWWLKYICSKKFRFDQELEAYRAQYKFFVKYYHPTGRQEFLNKIARDLSSQLYGNICTFDEAIKAIMR